jgi:hypothetical protein
VVPAGVWHAHGPLAATTESAARHRSLASATHVSTAALAKHCAQDHDVSSVLRSICRLFRAQNVFETRCPYVDLEFRSSRAGVMSVSAVIRGNP